MAEERTPGKEKIEMINHMTLEVPTIGQKTWANFLGDASSIHFTNYLCNAYDISVDRNNIDIYWRVKICFI